MDRFSAMQIFIAVVDQGSFVQAAQALGLSKTAVSRQLTELEALLGTRLLQRTTRRLSLTPEGEVYLDRCRRILADLAEAEAEMTAQAAEVVGRLRVNVPVSFGQLHLAPLWPAFMSLHPQVELDITLSDRVVDLVDEGYDLAVRVARLEPSTLISRQLTSTRLVLCASPQYLQRQGRPEHPADLARHAVIGYSLLATGDMWEFTGPQGPSSVRVNPRMKANSGDTCCAAALQHQGIVLQPTFLVGPHLATGALVELMPAWSAGELGVHAVYPSRRHLTPKVRALVDFLVDAFRMRGWPD